MKEFPEIPDELNHSQAEADGSINQSMASATDYLQSMTMNEWCEILHSETNQSFLLDQVIDNAMDVLSENAKSFEKVTQSMFDDGNDDGFVVTQDEIDAMVSNIPTPKSKQSNLIPMVLLLMQSINGTTTNRPLVALCDSGSSHCMFNKKALPFGATTFKTQAIRTTTTQGTYDCDEAVVLSNLSLPEFVNGRKITNLSAQVFDSENCHYDVILGRDFMKSIGLDIQFSTGSIKWLDTIVDMKHISMYDHIKEDITDIGIQANNRDAMMAWRSYQEDILFDEID